ncbi:MAG: NADH-quinone oxidoreductase subunit NuoF [Dehalococcoidales bacterium]|nr:NADH-quinone oxidoreductase subunit NuoF [Dehalococcoidales bacterium]
MNFTDLKEKATAEWTSLEQSRQPRIIVGTGTCGRAAGAFAVVDAIKTALAAHNVQADIMNVGCIGLCYAEPLVEIAKPGKPHIMYGNVTPASAAQLIEDYLVKDMPHPEMALGTIGEGSIEGIPKFWELPMLKPQVRIILRDCGIIDPQNLNHYIARDGYSGLVKALKMKPEEVIAEVKKSGLRGRGGAGFPAATKWELCRKEKDPTKYIICNADEGDPGAFMNRMLVEGDPHSVLEGMIIGAYAMGATRGFIYCRAEKPLAIERFKFALKQVQEAGFLGKNILGSGFDFDIELREGAGAFVCGEETALMASIEGKRGMPNPRPPFPAQSGLWGKPTNINNVETWANVSAILQHSAEWYTQYGTEKSKGTKTFALAGKINRTGLIEVPMGITLREIVFGIGGGILNDKGFKAIQCGGPSGGCLPTSQLDLTVDYDSLQQAGAIIGSGGMIVMDEDNCMVDVARYFMSFIQSESCGKCVPCRVGTKHMLDILTKMTQGKGTPEDVNTLNELAQSVKQGALCGLGQTAPNPVLTTYRYFADEYEAHTKNKVCPALACKEMTTYYILPEKCQGCGICLRACPSEAIKGGKRMIHVIDQDKCVKCGTCLEVCPPKFTAVKKVSGEKIEVPKEPVPVIAGKPGAGETK